MASGLGLRAFRVYCCPAVVDFGLVEWFLPLPLSKDEPALQGGVQNTLVEWFSFSGSGFPLEEVLRQKPPS